jgi:hypothetical protein
MIATVAVPAPLAPNVTVLLLSEPESRTPVVPIVLPEIVPMKFAPTWDPGSRLR